ncbi:MAG: DUF1959 family protein [Methanobrevibacter sp.]|uniref:DUF1959 family protein n=1 Tax=Methanobrevibacter sp. TaxID=66852 RepID=UPI0026DFC55E|nr:DUF1959 family protein [Methanobrevibacter sp.]MDO5849011.1 DUF1959 family protein [Methanobrevibacter sp.]
MNDEERLILMKQRIIQSFRWHKDIIVPIADEFGITEEEMADIFMNALDMSSLESLHSTLDSAEYIALKGQIYIDLRLCWLSRTLELVTPEQAEDIQIRLADAVYDHGKPYEDALEEGRAEILEILRNTSIKEE